MLLCLKPNIEEKEFNKLEEKKLHLSPFYHLVPERIQGALYVETFCFHMIK